MSRKTKLIALAVDQAGEPEGVLAAMAAMRHELTRDEAMTLYGLEWWEHADPEMIGEACLNQARLCCPFDAMHKAMEVYMGRPVWSHEFADPARLKAERRGTAVTDPLEMLVRLVGPERVIVLQIDAANS